MYEMYIMLRKNRRILEELNPTGKSKTTRAKRTERIHFTYHTSTYITKAGATYFFCYEYGYLPIENDWLVLVKKTKTNLRTD